MGLHDPLTTYNTHYGQNKGWESKCQFDSRPLKVNNHFELHACKGHATYHWKVLDKGYNFVLDLTSIEGLHKKLYVSKMTRVSISGLTLNLRILRKMTFGCSPRGQS